MPRNVLLIVLDSVRAESTSLHGYHRDTTPFLSEFSAEATTFLQARAPSVASLPSHVSMFTGHHAAEHKLGNDSHHEGVRLSEGVTIWEELADEHGYVTGVFSNNPYLTSVPVGLQNAFDTVVTQIEPPFLDAVDPREYYDEGVNYLEWIRDCLFSGSPIRSVVNGIAMKLSQDDNTVCGFPVKYEPKGFADLFLNWIDNHSTQPWAACINLMDAHAPYTPASKYDKWSTGEDWVIQSDIDHFRWEFLGGQRPLSELERLKNLYDGAIYQADSKVREIITGLEARKSLEDTLVIITSDHGEGFGEPSRIRPNQHAVEHTVGIHESQLHVPLLVRHPNQKYGRTVDALSSLTNFPSVIRKYVEENNSPDKKFISKDHVLAAQLALNKKTLEIASSYNVDSENISGIIKTKYSQDEHRIYKYISWKGKFRAFSIDGDEVTEINQGSESEEKLNKLYDFDIGALITERHTANTADSVQERLKYLGYT